MDLIGHTVCAEDLAVYIETSIAIGMTGAHPQVTSRVWLWVYLGLETFDMFILEDE